jgi:hypothetical protein
MNTDNISPTPITDSPTVTPKPAFIDDDLDFSDVQLSSRQESATHEIVCEGGCE